METVSPDASTGAQYRYGYRAGYEDGWRAASEVVDFEGEKVWAHQVMAPGQEFDSPEPPE